MNEQTAASSGVPWATVQLAGQPNGRADAVSINMDKRRTVTLAVSSTNNLRTLCSTTCFLFLYMDFGQQM
jgi:hypothetical protein